MAGTPGSDFMTSRSLEQAVLQDRLESIIDRMQYIQRAIRTSGQPVSMGEIAELKKLGREYTDIMELLSEEAGGTDIA
jgi:hypothetical protein